MGKEHQEPNGSALDYKRKNRWKAVKTTVQVLILALVVGLIVDAVGDFRRYEPVVAAERENRNGFVAISYFGISRSGTEQLLSRKQLEAQLKALRQNGYATISQQDIRRFYEEGKPLPDNGLFLSFEDGRTDSIMYAQPLLEQMNYQATALTYSNNFGRRNTRFLQPKDVRKLREGGFWELGSNGHRLAYINIFDESGNYVGHRTEEGFVEAERGGQYTHYLMDFKRDKDGIPEENRQQMQERIKADYDAMQEVYNRELGEVPNLYMIMHANHLYNGMHPMVQEINDTNIRKLFPLHFNREGNAWNRADSDPHNLTRVQVKPYWQTNHLIMQLVKNTGRALAFETGSAEQAKVWQVVSGAAEFKGNLAALTSPPESEGVMLLNGDANGKEADWKARNLEADWKARNLEVELALKGNVLGSQSIYLRADERLEQYVRLQLKDNVLLIEEKLKGQEPVELVAYVFDDVDKLHGVYPLNARASRSLRLVLQDDQMKVWLGMEASDAEPLLKANVSETSSGYFALGSQASEVPANHYKAEERDDIYDALFEDLRIVSKDEADTRPMFSNRYQGIEIMEKSISGTYHRVIDWAIETF